MLYDNFINMTIYSAEDLKKNAALKAASFVEDGMLVGLGTGSTAKYAVEEVGRRIATGEIKVFGTPTSFATLKLAKELEIPLKDLEEIQDGEIDIDIDGADQIDLKTGTCLKGGGGAHYWEKKVARKSKQIIVIVDETKVVKNFAGYKVPLEIDNEKRELLESSFADLGLQLTFRESMSDSNNYVADTIYDGSIDLLEFEKKLLAVDGVLDTGVFHGLVTKIIVAKTNGEVDVIDL